MNNEKNQESFYILRYLLFLDCRWVTKMTSFRKIMTWFCVVLLLVVGMFWAFTDSEPDVALEQVPTEQQSN